MFFKDQIAGSSVAAEGSQELNLTNCCASLCVAVFKEKTSSLCFVRVKSPLSIKRLFLPCLIHRSLCSLNVVAHCSFDCHGAAVFLFHQGKYVLLIVVSCLMSHVFLYQLESFKLISLGNALMNLTY